MTFLEYIARKVLGPPEMHKGELRWTCPKCGSRGFHVRPHRPPYKDRFSCWTCAWWGDESDLLAHFFPREDYGRRLDRLEALRQEYEHDGMPEPYFTRGVTMIGNAYDRDPREDEFSPEANLAIESLLEHLDGQPHEAFMVTMKAVRKALEICAEHGLHPAGFAGRVEYVAWVRDTDVRHMAECDDSGCDWACCRLARGWTRDADAVTPHSLPPRTRPQRTQSKPTRKRPRKTGA